MQKSRLMKIILLSCVFILFPGYCAIRAYSKPSGFELTEEEQAYLETLRSRPIVIAYSYDIVQAEFEGESFGIMDPVLDVLQGEFGLEVDLLKTGWYDAFIQLENGKADFYGPIALSDGRRQKYITVDPFHRAYSKIVTRVDNPIASMTGLYNCSIGLLTGSIMSKTMQTYLGPRGQTLYFPTLNDMIAGLENGSIDAFATVDNAEFEIFRHHSIQFEFSIDNFHVDQGLISSRQDMAPLAALLNRYLKVNPSISNQIAEIRQQALMRNARENLLDQIVYLQENYDEVTLCADATYYPLCYIENGKIKGMQLEINQIFENLTGIPIRFALDEELPDGMESAMEKLKADDYMGLVGRYYDVDIWNDPAVEYSPLVWMETIRTYSYKDIGDNLLDRAIGTTRYNSNYLGWNNTTGKEPSFYYSHKRMMEALKTDEIDVVFMGEMRFNYSYTVLKDYRLREVSGVFAEAPMHMIYGSHNKEFNAVFNESMRLFHVLNPQSFGMWKMQGNKYKSDSIRIRYNQQIGSMVVMALFTVMLAALFFMLNRNREAHRHTQVLLNEVQDKQQLILSGIDYASKIQKDLLTPDAEFAKAFLDYSVLWEPRDIVGGDIYWLKNFREGTILCVCDCTGHGTPGALLTMLAISAFETIVNENTYKDTANVIWELEQRLANVLNAHSSHSKIKDGCDLAVLYIAENGDVTISSAYTHVFVCDGIKVTQIKGQKLYIGEGRLKSKKDIHVTVIPYHPDNKYYVASDGLYDQMGGNPQRPFGYKTFKKIIFENHHEKQNVISTRIWGAFENHRGSEARRDDVELITFIPKRMKDMS